MSSVADPLLMSARAVGISSSALSSTAAFGLPVMAVAVLCLGCTRLACFSQAPKALVAFTSELFALLWLWRQFLNSVLPDNYVMAKETDPELSVCQEMTMEIVPELPSCPVTTTEAITELPLFCFSQ